MSKKLRILVVEDKEENINAARAMLADHDVTIVTGYDQARAQMTYCPDNEVVARLLKEQGLPENRDAYKETYGISCWNDDDKERKGNWVEAEAKAEKDSIKPFDVVLTDVMLPKGGYACMSFEGKVVVNSQGIMPYGAYIFLYAIETGTKRVGMITSGNHHDDPFVYALDRMRGFVAGDIKTVITNDEEVYVRTSDWATVVRQVGNRCEDNAKNVEWVELEEWKKIKQNGQIARVKNWFKLLDDLLKL